MQHLSLTFCLGLSLLFAVSTTVLAPEQAFADDKSKKEQSKKAAKSDDKSKKAKDKSTKSDGSKKSDKSQKKSKKSDKGHPHKVVICHSTPYGGVVIDASQSSLAAHNGHGDRLVDAAEGLQLGDACDVESTCQVYWSDTDGDGLGDPGGAVEFCGAAGPGFILPGQEDFCPDAFATSNKGCPLF